MPTEGSHGTYGYETPIGSGSNGSIGHVCYHCERQSVRFGNGGLFSKMCPLPDKTALAVADAFFQHIVCRFGMPPVIHLDQGWEFENKVMHELCLLCEVHKIRTTLYHPESDGLVERFNRTLFMMLAMFAGENHDDWDYLLLAVMMAYRSSVHEPTGFSPYRLLFGEALLCLWMSVFRGRNRTCRTR